MRAKWKGFSSKGIFLCEINFRSMTESALIDPKFLVTLVNEGTVTQNGREASVPPITENPSPYPQSSGTYSK